MNTIPYYPKKVKIDQLTQKADDFFNRLKLQMQERDIVLPPHWSIDHLCYRVDTISAYNNYKQEFSRFGKLLIESEIAGRPIATFKLFEPLSFLNRKIDLLELPAPKAGKTIPEGFEHIEVVCDLPLIKIKEMFNQMAFGESGLKKAFNAELELRLTGMAIKFHNLSLESVIKIENNQKVFSALKKSEVLSQLNSFSPLVAGTFPLGLQTEGSDLDILLSHHDIDAALERVESLYKNTSSFDSYKNTDTEGKRYGVARFLIDEIPFEIYIEKTPTIQQRAYMHFQIEERLLKLGGEKLKNQILAFRQKGMKTEPAFGAALNLDSDPYQKLVEMHSWSEEKLNSFLHDGVRPFGAPAAH
jgi:predicted metalloenzyme YecM